MATYLLTTVGTAGDVFPFIVLAGALQARGHKVGILANPYFEKRVRAAGVSFYPLGTEEAYREALAAPEIWKSRGLVRLLESLLPPLRESYAQMVSHIDASTVVLTHPFFFAARIARETLPNACVTLLPSPMLLRSNYETPVLYGSQNLNSMARPLKRLMWWMADHFYLDRIVGKKLNELRGEVGLETISRPFNGWLYSPDRTIGLFPDWFAPPQPDWPGELRLSGFPLFKCQEGLPDQVARFLKAGSPPVVFTPSTGVMDVRRFREAAMECCQRLGVRGLFLAMLDDDGGSDDFLCARFAPLEEVLPESRALVHSGGVGTAAAAIAAGIPQLVIPLAFDQPDNAARIVRLGLGRRCSSRQARVAAMSASVAAILEDEAMRVRCVEFSSRIDRIATLNQICALVEEVERQEP